MALCLSLLMACWGLLGLAALWAPRLGDSVFCGAFLVGALLAVASRPPAPRRRARASLTLCALGLACGAAVYPALLGAVATLGLALGLAPGAAPRPVSPSPWLFATAVLAAPLFEELLYRERLLPVLARRLGAGPGLLLSSAAFALPHLEVWSLLASFCVGLLLGALMLRTRCVLLCIGIHAGLNASALHVGAAPAAFLPGLLVGLVLLRVSIALADASAPASRSGRSVRRPPGAPPR